jgi:hypothetical protein
LMTPSIRPSVARFCAPRQLDSIYDRDRFDRANRHVLWIVEEHNGDLILPISCNYGTLQDRLNGEDFGGRALNSVVAMVGVPGGAVSLSRRASVLGRELAHSWDTEQYSRLPASSAARILTRLRRRR